MAIEQWGFSSHTYFDHLQGPMILTTTPLPVSSEGSTARHTYWDTENPFIMVISMQGPVTLTPIAESLTVELSLPFFYDL